MEKITFRHDVHKALWNLLAEHGDWDKKRAVKELNGKIDIDLEKVAYRCPACQAATELMRVMENDYSLGHTNTNRCRYCPLNWGDNLKCTEGGDTFDDMCLYDKWLEARCYEDAAEYADIIANLPLTDDAREYFDIVE